MVTLVTFAGLAVVAGCVGVGAGVVADSVLEIKIQIKKITHFN